MFIVTYDVKQNHTEFKKKLFDQGFFNCIAMQEGANRQMPNTTVAHLSNSYADVKAAFDTALKNTAPNAQLEKVAYVLSGGLWLHSDQTC